MGINVINITNEEERKKFLQHLQNNEVSAIQSPILTRFYIIYEKELVGKNFLTDGQLPFVPYVKNKNSTVFYLTNPLNITSYILKMDKKNVDYLDKYKRFAEKATFKNEYICAVLNANNINEVCTNPLLINSFKYVSTLNKTFGYDVSSEIIDTINNKQTKEWVFYKNSVSIFILVKYNKETDEVICDMVTKARTRKIYHYRLINEKIFACYRCEN